jgi:hypothetical protein
MKSEHSESPAVGSMSEGTIMVGGAAPAGARYPIYVAGLDLTYRTIDMVDRLPPAKDLIAAAGCVPAEDFVILKVLPTSELQALRFDEVTDLGASADSKFVVAKSDRTFRFFLDGKQQEWPAAHISGITLQRLGQRASDTVEVVLERPGATDEVIGEERLVDLGAAGVERLYFRPLERMVDIVVNRRPVKIERGERTGLEIKEAAIVQHVPIQLDFVLTLHKAGGGTKVIGDFDRVRVHNEQRFTAVADDDKS